MNLVPLLNEGSEAMTKRNGILDGLVEAKIMATKRNVDICRKQLNAGKHPPEEILEKMKELDELIFSWQAGPKRKKPVKKKVVKDKI